MLEIGSDPFGQGRGGGHEGSCLFDEAGLVGADRAGTQRGLEIPVEARVGIGFR